MPRISEIHFERDVTEALAELLSVEEVKTHREPLSKTDGRQEERIDFLASAGEFIFAVESKRRGDAATVGQAVRTAAAAAEAHKKGKAIPLVVVPYMGDIGRRLCEEANVAWLDLSGNASLFGRPGLRIHIEGKPNQFKVVGRPQNLFAPKSARIARCLLMAPVQAFSQRELAERTGLDEGFTSRIVRGMEERQLVRRNKSGAVVLADPEIMLEAWREAYDFNKHNILRGHVAGRSGMDVLKQSAAALGRHGLRYAATGLAGTWLVNQFAGFRLAVIYVEDFPGERPRAELGFREETRGANLWLVKPNDAGVFHGGARRDGIDCVHPVQLYVDLKNHPERSQEAAEALKPLLFREETAYG